MKNRLLRAMATVLEFLPGARRSPRPRNILVVRLGNLGDIIVALPAFHALRREFPDARMTLLTSPTKRGRPSAEGVLLNDPTFNEMLVYYDDDSGNLKFLWGLLTRIRRGQYDLAVLLPDDMTTFKSAAKYLALFACSGIRRVVGAQIVNPRDPQQGQVPRLMALLKPLTPREVEPFPWIRVSEEDEQYAGRLLAQCRRRPVVGMNCGAKRPANRWLPQRFIEVGRWLVTEKEACVLLTGDPSEAEGLGIVADEIGPDCINLAGKTTIAQLAAVLSQCDLLLTNDTGTMHVAAAMGIPVVALFGGRDYKYRWHPFGEAHEVLRKDIECSPCLKDTCPLYEIPKCMEQIPVNEVIQVLDGILGRLVGKQRCSGKTA